MPRSSTCTPKAVEAICALLSEGEPLAAICRRDGMPGLRTVYDWGDADADVAARIARAREEGEESLAAGCLEIADDSRNDWMARAAENGDEKAGQYNGENVARSKLRIDTRLKLLAKWNPKKWGDKSQHELVGANGGPIETKAEVIVRPPITRDEWLREHGLDSPAGAATSGT